MARSEQGKSGGRTRRWLLSRCAGLVVLAWLTGGAAAFALEFDLPEQQVQEAIEEGKRRGATDVDQEYTVGPAKVGEEEVRVRFATKRYELLKAAAEREGFSVADGAGIVARDYFRVTVVIERQEPYQEPDWYEILFYQNSRILMPIERSAEEQGATLSLTGRFREKIFDPNGAATFQVYPGGTRAHAPHFFSISLDLSQLR